MARAQTALPPPAEAATTAAAPQRERRFAAVKLLAPMHVRLQGELLRPARFYWSASTPALPCIEVLIGQPGGKPVRAVQQFAATEAAAYAAVTKARTLRAGALVYAHGLGLGTGRFEGEETLHIINTTHLTPSVLPYCGRAAAAGSDAGSLAANEPAELAAP
jgi:hypothetical protein